MSIRTGTGLEWVRTLNLRCKSWRVQISLHQAVNDCQRPTRLWVPFNPSSLLANARLVRLCIYHIQQVQGIVDASSGEALGLPWFVAGLFQISSAGPVSRTCGLGILFLITSLFGGGLLRCRAGFLFRKEAGSFCLPGELLLALGLLIGSLLLFRTLLPLGGLLTFL